ncbi:hypothetical protein XENTR_v10000779 [Xenopus tropicalis]|nr:hypothetical protein XENTR_v10000779 [Xenopus tropicalis]
MLYLYTHFQEQLSVFTLLEDKGAALSSAPRFSGATRNAAVTKVSGKPCVILPANLLEIRWDSNTQTEPHRKQKPDRGRDLISLLLTFFHLHWTKVNALIAASVFSCFTTLIVIVYASLTLGYGEDDDDIFSSPPHVIHARFILGKLVQGANIAMLIASVSSLCVALCIAYMGCRSLPQCMCYDDITGMDWLHPEDEQPQTVELVCTFRGGDERIFNSASQFTDCNTETEEEFSRPPPYVRFS